jgi:hypothetical protein
MRVFFVWAPMIEGDCQSEAVRIARRLASRTARHFYDPQRRTGLAFVEEYFHEELRQAQAALPKEHPLHERLGQWLEAPAERMLWDAVLFFPPGAEWNTRPPNPAWWSRQVNFYGDKKRGKPSAQFLRNRIRDGPYRVGLV